MEAIEDRRASFDTVAELYNRVRPGYPEAMYRDLAEKCGLASESRILEIGCGTGQATVDLAKLGCTIIAVEIGENLARIARENLASCTNTTVVADDFERWEFRGPRFDLIVSATAFHWLMPETAYEKCACLLVNSGHLALFSNNHIRRDEGFFARSQSVYDRYRLPSGGTAPSEEERRAQAKAAPQECRDRFFQRSFTKRYPWSIRYTADEYTALLMTYSDHIAIPENYRTPLLRGLHNLIVGEYGGEIVKHYETELEVFDIRNV